MPFPIIISSCPPKKTNIFSLTPHKTQLKNQARKILQCFNPIQFLCCLYNMHLLATYPSPKNIWMVSMTGNCLAALPSFFCCIENVSKAYFQYDTMEGRRKTFWLYFFMVWRRLSWASEQEEDKQEAGWVKKYQSKKNVQPQAPQEEVENLCCCFRQTDAEEK